ncbi:MAG: 50S ribosomal protein L6 [Euryarchaeota archaeon]|nr:50S ribosomal protein L6 [Euryarchaeota archaeon]
MASVEATEKVKVPDGVNVTIAGQKVTVKGPKGELVREFAHPQVTLSKEDGSIVVHAEFPRRQVKAVVGTWASHIRNMCMGVTEEYEYKMKIVYSHFPIKTKIAGTTFLIENFLGERTARKAPILQGVKVNVAAEWITITGIDLERVSQTAANIEQACKIRDRDPRVFQDGIYITQKGK